MSTFISVLILLEPAFEILELSACQIPLDRGGFLTVVARFPGVSQRNLAKYAYSSGLSTVGAARSHVQLTKIET